jgi:transposase
MDKIREILRHKWHLGHPHRQVAEALGISAGGVGTTVTRAQEAGLDWEQVTQLSDEALQQRLYGHKAQEPDTGRSLPDCPYIHAERKRVGVTLELLHEEYLAKHQDGYQYTQFCEYYRRWLAGRKLSMRQVHYAGDKIFVDYSGKKLHLIDRKTGERTEVELFVAVLGASNYTFAQASASQRGPDFIKSHVQAYEFFGGVAKVTVCDQLKSGVSVSCRYEPTIQRTYEQMAQHYGTTVLPARPRHPRDKAKVEVGVQIAQRWILARLRNETFFSLEDLNFRIDQLLGDLNGRPMRLYKASRRDLFERLDRPVLLPLPAQRFVYCEWKTARVNIDYHVELDHHYYSVPHALLHQQVEARLTGTTVELYHHGQRVGAHLRSYQAGSHTTVPEHMPKAHRKHLEWSPGRLCHWASTVGPHVEALVRGILSDRPHPEQGYRSCLGILRLDKSYGKERLEAACRRALSVNARSYRHVESILKNGLDRMPLPGEAAPETTPASQPEAPHPNIRGRTYYR